MYAYVFMHVCMHASMYVYLCICRPMYYAYTHVCVYAGPHGFFVKKIGAGTKT